jgi:hypothetical protein
MEEVGGLSGQKAMPNQALWNVAVSLKKGYVILPKAITKKKRRRIIRLAKPPADRTVRRGLSGKICFDWSTPQAGCKPGPCGNQTGHSRRRQPVSQQLSRIESSKPATCKRVRPAIHQTLSRRRISNWRPEEDANKWFRISPAAKRLDELRSYAAALIAGLLFGIRKRETVQPPADNTLQPCSGWTIPACHIQRAYEPRRRCIGLHYRCGHVSRGRSALLALSLC